MSHSQLTHKETVAQVSIRDQVRLITNEIDYILMRKESAELDEVSLSNLIEQQGKLNAILDRIIAAQKGLTNT